jgi:hypothetical protein
MDLSSVPAFKLKVKKENIKNSPPIYIGTLDFASI